MPDPVCDDEVPQTPGVAATGPSFAVGVLRTLLARALQTFIMVVVSQLLLLVLAGF